MKKFVLSLFLVSISLAAFTQCDTCSGFYIPNAFTPDGDRDNDIFNLTHLVLDQPILKIFDKWGIKVYESNDLYWTGDGGTGYYGNNDVYVWVLEYKDKDGFYQTQKGFVTLIR